MELSDERMSLLTIMLGVYVKTLRSIPWITPESGNLDKHFPEVSESAQVSVTEKRVHTTIPSLSFKFFPLPTSNLFRICSYFSTSRKPAHFPLEVILRIGLEEQKLTV